MKILLINPMSSRKPPIKGRGAHFPVGIGFIAAYLKHSGCDVDILDNEVECLNKYALEDFIRASSHDVFGITGMSGQYRYVKGLSRIIKRLKDKPVVLGGPLATYSFETVLNKTDVDVCVIGEGEETIVDLVENMDRLDNVAGIAYRINGKVKKTSPRVFKKSRDEYPFPAYELFNMEPYFKKLQVQYEGWGARYLNKDVSGIKNIGIVTGIGCPYRCKFCSRSVIKPRIRSTDNIIAEIEYCMDRFGINGVRFMDDLLIISEKRALDLCEKIGPLNITWSGQARSNVLNDKIAKAMRKAGGIGVGLGYESGSDRLLKAMNKKVTVEDHKRATLAAKKNGLAIRVQLMFGYPGENRDTIEETISFFEEIEIPPRRFNILTPLPGSELYDECVSRGTIGDEDKYLEAVSTMEAGFGAKKVLINLTEMSDEEYEALLLYAEKQMEENYKRIIKGNRVCWSLELTRYHLIRQLRRARKIGSAKAWKNKFRSVGQRTREAKLDKDQVEELYFGL